MPGMATRPVTLIWLRLGVRPATHAALQKGSVASQRVAPSASRSSTYKFDKGGARNDLQKKYKEPKHFRVSPVGRLKFITPHKATYRVVLLLNQTKKAIER